MQNFQRLAVGIDVMPAMHALIRNPGLWNENTLRTTFENTPHAEVDDIWLRFNLVDGRPISQIGDDLEAVNCPAWNVVPVKAIILDLMRRIEAVRLGRVLITKLAPGKRILPHADVLGDYAAYYNRYHIVLQGLPGSIFRAGNESVCMQTGECWWFNAHAEHEVVNNSADDRVHMLVDVRLDQ